jgi:pimeloyl-ACP methyl ester carboxylesterase
MRLRVASVVAAASLALAGCASSQPQPVPPPASPSTPAPALERYYGQELSWSDCGQHTECADLTVPKDYAHPEQGDVQIAVARYRSKDGALGSLVYNPGGPGGSGVEFAKAAPYVMSKDVLESYDFVSFDPRGVGDSDPVECLSDKQVDGMISADPAPDTRAEVTDLTKLARTFGQGCEQNSPAMLGFIDSESVVKDMDILRAALGEERLNFMGSSYGTKLGALYAQEFGPRVGRMVLNGVLPPNLTGDEIALGQAKGFDDALRRYVGWCQQQPECPVTGADVAAGTAKIQAFLARLADKPLDVGGRQFTEGLGIQGILFLLYYPYNGDWQALSTDLKAAFAGDAKPFMNLVDERMERRPDGSYNRNGNAYEALVAVSCLDGPAETDPAKLAQRAKDWAGEAPVFGAVMAWSGLVCLDWPVAPTGTPTPVTAQDAGPILVLGTKHDPATPYEWAVQLSDQLADAHLVTWDSDGHTAYANGSQCIDDAVDAYLLDGTLPEQGLVCT